MFKVGDYVYASAWCYGVVTEIDDLIVRVEFETPGGGGSFSFYLDELEKPRKEN